MYFLYIIQSETSGRFYVGHTDRLEARTREHDNGQSPATRGRGPWSLVHTEQFVKRGEAVRRERETKSWKSHRSIEELIASAR